jgi:L-fuconate dehydratase
VPSGPCWSATASSRWVGPEKGVIHLAAAALVNALWDLYAKDAGKLLWKLLADLSPEEFARCIPFRYITDAITPDEALDMLRRNDQTKGEREAYLREHGYPSYTTSAGWLGYSDDKLSQLCRAGLQNGWTHFKQKVGRDLADDVRRARIICEEIGPDRTLMMDANHVWDVDQAINWMRELVDFNPL